MLGSALLCQAHEASKAHAAVLVQLEDQEQALMEAREVEAKVKKDNRKIHARVQELETKLHGWESPGKQVLLSISLFASYTRAQIVVITRMLTECSKRGNSFC